MKGLYLMEFSDDATIDGMVEEDKVLDDDNDTTLTSSLNDIEA